VIQGTAGGLRGLQAALPGEDPVIAWNGDILFAPDLGAIVEGHRRSGAAATMVLLPMPAGRTYGTVEVDAGGAVRRISGVGLATPGLTPWHFSGVHVLSPAVFAAMAPSGPADINREVYPRLFASGAVRGEVLDAAWSDLGAPGTYLDAQADVLAGRVEDVLLGNAGGSSRRTPGPFLGAGARVHPSAALGADTFVDAGVEVPAGARVERSALLVGATVAPGEQVRGEIRWEGGGRLSERP
jgi:mannose-1-phosphate guanylyltransferase